MTKPLLVQCDNCRSVTDVKFKKAIHPNGIEETYFKCVSCHYRYTSFVTDKKVRKMQKKLKAMPRRADEEFIKMLDEKQLEINSRMSQLKYNLINFGRADL